MKNLEGLKTCMRLRLHSFSGRAGRGWQGGERQERNEEMGMTGMAGMTGRGGDGQGGAVTATVASSWMAPVGLQELRSYQSNILLLMQFTKHRGVAEFLHYFST
ncbi:Protein of unknown function [Gryllus bimaculatus]|nr:Protein of unknown function [Gryllus bimaculatus]